MTWYYGGLVTVVAAALVFLLLTAAIVLDVFASAYRTYVETDRLRYELDLKRTAGRDRGVH